MSLFECRFDERLQSLSFSSHRNIDGILYPQKSPAIILDTLSLLLSALRSGQSLVVSTPTRESFGQVLASLLAVNFQLDVDENERFLISGEDDPSFNPGDKLKMGNAVVEYVRNDVSTGGAVVRYNPKSPLLHTLTREQSLLLQKTDSNRGLSPSKTFNEELKALRNAIRLTPTDHMVINELKRKKTFAKSTVVYVGQLNRTSRFCTDTDLSGSTISDLILCSRIDWAENSEVPYYHPIGRGQYSGIPSLAIAHDLTDVIGILPSTQNAIRAIVIDADNPDNFIEHNIEDIRRLRDENIPMFAIVSNANAFSTSTLRKDGFAEWRWDRRTLATNLIGETTDKASECGFFDNLNTRCANCSDAMIQVTACSDNRVDKLLSLMNELNNLLGDGCIDDAVENVRQELWMTTVRILRAIVPFNTLTHLPHNDSDESWEDTLFRRRGYIPSNVFPAFMQAIDCVSHLLQEEDNPKARLLSTRIASLAPGDSLTIVTRTANEADEALAHWSPLIGNGANHKVKFLPISGLKAQKAPVAGRMIVCGWLAKDRMTSIVYGYSAPIVELMLYQGCETDWYISQTNAWKLDLENHDDTERVLALPGIETLRMIGHLSPPLTLERRRMPVDDAEDKWKQQTYKRHEAKGAERQHSVEVIPVRYAEDLISFYRETSILVDVTPIILADTIRTDELADSSRAIRQRVGDPTGLREGSFVLMRQTDKDVLEQLADQLFLKSNAPEIRHLAQLWREALRELYDRHDNDDQTVYDILKLYGMNKSYQAFKTLREDPEKIAPGRSRDEISETVVALARSLNNPELESESDTIADAALSVQNAHRSAGRNLSKMLGDAFSNYLAGSGISKPDDIWEPIPFYLNELGEVTIYRITEIDREHRIYVAQWKVGKIFEE